MSVGLLIRTNVTKTLEPLSLYPVRVSDLTQSKRRLDIALFFL